MTRAIAAYVLSMILAVTGLSLATARGTAPDIGVEVVICSGVGMTTITLGPDGEPVKQTHLCPDAVALFAATFSVPALGEPQIRLLAYLSLPAPVLEGSRDELTPSARGPPVPV